MTKKYLLLLLLIFLFQNKVFSQIKISGQIKDEKNNPVEFIEIQLQNKDSIIFKSELTNSEGKFTLETEKGKYSLLIRQLGKIYHNQKIDATQDIYIGVISITEKTQELQEVVITSKKKLIERKVDRLIFNVENSISASGGDAIDALKVTPSIRVQNDIISMIGKNGMGIMVNDKIIQLSGDDLINYLKNLKSDDIKKIEVITSPPSKYEAQGNSGLVNIVLKSAKSNSFNGSFRNVLSQSNKTIGSTGFSLNYQKNKTTITSNVNYSNGVIEPIQEYNLSYPTYLWQEKNNKTNYTDNLGGRITLDYQLSTKTKIGTEYTHSKSKPLIKSINNSFIYNRNTIVLDSIIRNESRLDFKRNTNSINIYSITEIDTLGKKISFDFDYLNFKSNSNNNFSSNSFFPNNSLIPNSNFIANNGGVQNIDIYTAKLDFEYPTNWANFSFGSKLSFIKNESDVSFFNLTTGNSIFDPSKSNIFEYNENIQAFYFSGNKKLSNKLELQLGLRAENTQTTGFSKTLNETNKNNYFKLFPTVFLSYNINEDKSLSLNYSKRIDRPSYSDLNPFRFYSTSFNFSEGNPFLNPSFSDNFELSYTYKNAYSSLYVNYLENGFDQVTYVEQNSIIQKVRPNNFFNQINYGFFQSFTFNIKDFWENSSDVSVFYYKTNSNIPNVVPSISAWSGSFNTQNSFILDKNKKYKAELSFMYQLPSLAGSYELSSYYQLNIGFKANYFSNKLQLSINAIDILKSNKQIFTQFVNNIKQENLDYADIRRLRISLVYNFGKKLNIEKKDNSNIDEKNRIK
jgi:hypothetical protein